MRVCSTRGTINAIAVELLAAGKLKPKQKLVFRLLFFLLQKQRTVVLVHHEEVAIAVVITVCMYTLFHFCVEDGIYVVCLNKKSPISSFQIILSVARNQWLFLLVRYSTYLCGRFFLEHIRVRNLNAYSSSTHLSNVHVMLIVRAYLNECNVALKFRFEFCNFITYKNAGITLDAHNNEVVVGCRISENSGVFELTKQLANS